MKIETITIKIPQDLLQFVDRRAKKLIKGTGFKKPNRSAAIREALINEREREQVTA